MILDSSCRFVILDPGGPFVILDAKSQADVVSDPGGSICDFKVSK